MQVRATRPVEVESARELLQASTWGKRAADRKAFADLVNRSQIALVAVEGEEFIGFLRELTDGIFNGYISMVVVDEEHRGKGVGTALDRSAMARTVK